MFTVYASIFVMFKFSHFSIENQAEETLCERQIFLSVICCLTFLSFVFFFRLPTYPKMSSLDMFEESPVLEAGGGGSSSEAAGSPPEDEEVVEEAVGSVLTDRTNTIHRDQVRFYILCPSRISLF